MARVKEMQKVERARQEALSKELLEGKPLRSLLHFVSMVWHINGYFDRREAAELTTMS